MLGCAQEKSLVDFMHTPYAWHIYPGVTWNRYQGDSIFDGINMHNHHNLGQHSGKAVFTVVVASQQQDIPYATSYTAIRRDRVARRFITATAYGMDELRQGCLYIGLEVVVAESQHTSTKEQEQQQECCQQALPRGPLLAYLLWSWRCQRLPRCYHKWSRRAWDWKSFFIFKDRGFRRCRTR